MTWTAWKALVAVAYGTTAQNVAAFNRAVAAYTKGRITREVDRDIPLSRSYRDEYAALRVALAGFSTNQNHATTLAAVNRLITVDANRPAIANFISDSVQHAMDELAAGYSLYDNLLLEAIIHIQQQVEGLQAGHVTYYLTSDLGAEGVISRGRLPVDCMPGAMSLLPYAPALAEEVAYEAEDRVQSNQRIYEVVTGGTISTGELGTGLASTDSDETEEIDGVVFQYVQPVADTPLSYVEWDALRAASQVDSEACAGHVWSINPTVTEFFTHPQVDAEHQLRMEWAGIKRSFSGDDEVQFGEVEARAAAEYIRAHLAAKLEENQQQARLAEERYQQALRNLVADFNARRAGS
jgi:hypothetical protein